MVPLVDILLTDGLPSRKWTRGFEFFHWEKAAALRLLGQPVPAVNCLRNALFREEVKLLFLILDR